MTESQFYAWLRPRLPGMSVRIENAISSGVPDVMVIHEGHTSWLELKVAYRHGETKPMLRPYQAAVHLRMDAHGGVRPLVIYRTVALDILVYRLPYKTTFVSGYHRIDSDPIHRFTTKTFTPEVICGILRENHAV